MKRALALAVATVFLCATPGLAQSSRQTSPVAPAAQPRVDFSARAAGIDSMAAARTHRDAARHSAAAPRQAGRSFWKSPWPYVIIGAVVGVGVIVASAGDGGLY